VAALSVLGVIAVLYVAAQATQLQQHSALQRHWAAFVAHERSIAPVLQLAARARDRVAHATAHTRARVDVVGSAVSHALQPTSDVDIKVVVPDCASFLPASRAIQALGFHHVFSGGTFALFSGMLTPGENVHNRAVDVSLSVEGQHQDSSSMDVEGLLRADASTSTANASPRHRGFLEFIIRRHHPDITVRREK